MKKYIIQVKSAYAGKWRTVDTVSSASMANSSIKGISSLVNLNHGDVVRSRTEGYTHSIAVFSEKKGIVVVRQTTAYPLDHIWSGDKGAEEQIHVINSFLGRSLAVECAILIARRIVNKIPKIYRISCVDCLDLAYECAVNRIGKLDLLYAMGERMNDLGTDATQAIALIAASSDPDADELFSDDLFSSIGYMEGLVSQRTMCNIISKKVPLSYLLLKIAKG